MVNILMVKFYFKYILLSNNYTENGSDTSYKLTRSSYEEYSSQLFTIPHTGLNSGTCCIYLVYREFLSISKNKGWFRQVVWNLLLFCFYILAFYCS